ncbi:MAG: sodium:calcium antiporter [Geminicoccaceae bacterium]
MENLNPANLGLLGSILVFVVASVIVWTGGVRLARGADALADKARLGHAYVGIFLLGAMVSLPEMTFSSVAAARGNADIAVNGLLGGIGMAMVVIAITDCVVGKEALSADIQRPVVMFQGAMVILMLTFAAAGIVVGDMLLPVVGLAGLWTVALAALYVITMLAVKRIEPRSPWKADRVQIRESRREKAKADDAKAASEKEKQRGLGAIVISTGLAALAVVAASTMLAFCAEVIAQETGLGDGFVGFMFGGIATTLPELSTTVAAARLRQFEMAFSDSFGTNLCSTGLIFVADALYRKGPILNEVDAFSLFGTLLGIALTAIYVAGLVVRSKRSILRMGIDSIILVIVAVSGFAALYSLS